jgi:uncharacterized surface protein with fasciclin (FAS1) repeats
MKIQYVLTLFASAFAIVSAADADVDTNKGSYSVGEDIKVSFADSDPHPQDWVGIYMSNTNLNHLENPLLWLYTCGDQHCNFAVQHDTLTFGSGDPDEGSRAHFPLPAGNYIAVLARNNHQPYEVRAFSHVFSIRNAPANTIIDLLEHSGNFNTLLAALGATGLDDVLRTAGPFTLFAPNDDAFALLGADTINFLLANLDVLTDILLYHVVGGNVLSTDLSDGSVTTLNTDDIHVDVRSNGDIIINGNTFVVDRDNLASNGVYHEINKVLSPPPDPASVSTNKDCYHVGEDIDVFFRSGGDAHPRDFVAIYYSDVNIHNLRGTLLWLYTCGDQHCSDAVESGTLTFGSGHPNESSSRAHFPLPAGHYRAILARGTHYPYEFLAGSHEFDINTSAHPCS